jgi:hypothetical protein
MNRRRERGGEGTWCGQQDRAQSRREMLRSCGVGFGGIALAAMLAERFALAGPATDGLRPPLLDPDATGALAERATHFAPRAKRVIFLFMHGGPSQVDTFDYKPRLQRDDGKPFPGEKPRVQFAETGNLLGSPWRFKQHGECGAWVSELFPNVAEIVDRLCFVKSLHGSNPAHGAALLKIHTGSETLVRPSMGSWVTYGLGSENQNLPGFVTISPTLGHGGVNNFSSAFLPAAHHGTPFGRTGIPADDAEFAHMHAGVPRDVQRAQLDLLAALNREHLGRTGEDPSLEGRIEAFELAFRMQAEAPWVVDTGSETPATLAMYGIDEKPTEDFGRQCLLARRFSEAGVRFVQCTHSYKWDQHGDLKRLHEQNSKEVDKPIAGLIRDLESRGMLEDTLVLWGGEFGRTPAAQGGTDGRDHNPHGFTWFMAGGGVKPGFSFGATDEFGWYAEEDKVHVHDLHATILALLGIDHERLTYHHTGRDHRLTDVHGHVVRQIFA